MTTSAAASSRSGGRGSIGPASWSQYPRASWCSAIGEVSQPRSADLSGGQLGLGLGARGGLGGVAVDHLALQVARLAVGAPARPMPVGVQVPGVGVVLEGAVEDVEQVGAQLLLANRGDELDAVVEVAGHQVGRADVDALRLAVALERVDSRVLEEAVDDRDHLDVLRDPLHAWAQGTDPAHVELHL